MLGFKHFAICIHRDDRSNPRVAVGLYARYQIDGIYRASKSYRAVASTAGKRDKMINQIVRIVQDGGESFDKSYGDMTIAMYGQWESRGFYLDFLTNYAKRVIGLGDELNYITRKGKKFEYLLKKLNEVEPNFL